MKTKKKAKKNSKKTHPHVCAPTTSVTNSQFYGVRWDAPSLDVLADVAKGLKNLTELFKSQNVEIKSLLTIGNPIGNPISFPSQPVADDPMFPNPHPFTPDGNGECQHKTLAGKCGCKEDNPIHSNN